MVNPALAQISTSSDQHATRLLSGSDFCPHPSRSR
eukprot:CAMPEP_0197477780 /NCGR_PEP_ID=MMETSP1309-20131121/20596_1 /TAXON_ID=464262 /ORGANISM="Genus nov. species nov., Strain RCC998" /LENGTH=34 /DNA_ID= /DNA_START= /DNA_END= /DNA_ORIENTATION=